MGMRIRPWEQDGNGRTENGNWKKWKLIAWEWEGMGMYVKAIPAISTLVVAGCPDPGFLWPQLYTHGNYWRENEQRAHSYRRSVFVDRTRAPRNCRMTGHRSWATRRCKATVDTSAGVCCRETRCTSGCRFPSTADDTPTSSCCPLRSQTRRTRPESFQCFRAARTCRTCLSQSITACSA